MLLLVSSAMTVVRRTCSVAVPAGSAVVSRTVSPMESSTPSGWTSAPSGTDTSTWMVSPAAVSTWPMESCPSSAYAAEPPARTATARTNEARRRRCIRSRPWRRASGRRCTLAWAIFSRNFGRRPVEPEPALGAALSSKPRVWSIDEDVLEGDHVALHPLHLGDVGDAARAVLEAGLVDDQVDRGRRPARGSRGSAGPCRPSAPWSRGGPGCRGGRWSARCRSSRRGRCSWPGACRGPRRRGPHRRRCGRDACAGSSSPGRGCRPHPCPRCWPGATRGGARAPG